LCIRPVLKGGSKEQRHGIPRQAGAAWAKINRFRMKTSLTPFPILLQEDPSAPQKNSACK